MQLANNPNLIPSVAPTKTNRGETGIPNVGKNNRAESNIQTLLEIKK